MRLIIIFTFIIFYTSAAAKADPIIVDAGRAALYSVDLESSENVVDIYARQINYMQRRLSFKRDLAERQKSFARPLRQAKANYEKNLVTVRDIRESEYITPLN